MSMKEKTEKVKEKAVEVKEKAKEKAKTVGEVLNKAFEEHPGLFFKVATIGGGLLVGIVSGAVEMDSQRNKKCQVVDDVTGQKYLTTHPLTNKEILELSDRMVNGQTHGEGLKEMGLLRNERKRR